MARIRLFVALILTAATLLAGVRYRRPTAIFVFDQHPDLPLEDFASGRLGLIQPTWARAHLYAAYRTMESLPFTPGEQRAYLEYVDGRLGGQAPTAGGPQRYDALRASLDLPWQAPASDGARRLGLSSDFTYTLLCVDDAFDLAAQTLQQRMDQFGADSEEVAEWVRGQDYVFEICVNRESKELPPAAPAEIDPLIRADRDYQQAAALFYTLQFDEARAAFRRIEQNPASPWRVWGPYMAGRSMLWKARFLEGRSSEYGSVLRQAESDLRTALADDGVRETHDAARYLLARILFRLKPADAAKLLAPRLLTPLGESNRSRQLRLFVELLDDAEYGDTTAPLRAAHDLIDWIFCFQSDDPAELAHAVDRWKENNSVAWLTAALAKAPGEHPDIPAMLHQAVEIGDHPATPTLYYHQARVLAERGETDLSRIVLDALIPKLEGLRSASNRAADLRSRVARGFRDFLDNGVQRPALTAAKYFEDAYERPWSDPAWFGLGADQQRQWLEASRGEPRLTPSAAHTLNRETPVRTLARLPGQIALPDPVKAQVLGAAWTRAVVLGQLELAAEIAPELGRLEPALAADLDRFVAAEAVDRRLEALLTLINAPGLSVDIESTRVRAAAVNEPDPRGLNWWRPSEIQPDSEASPGFLSAAQREQARQELARITALGRPYDWLLAAVEAEAEDPRPHPRTAEALYRLATIYEGVDLTWGYDPRPDHDPQRAARLLQFRFGNSEWARRIRAQ